MRRTAGIGPASTVPPSTARLSGGLVERGADIVTVAPGGLVGFLSDAALRRRDRALAALCLPDFLFYGTESGPGR